MKTIQYAILPEPSFGTLSCFSVQPEVGAAPNNRLMFFFAACLVISDPCYSIMGFEFGLFGDLLPVILLLTLQ